MILDGLPSWLAGNRYFGQAAGAILRCLARRHLVELDHQDAARCQARVLRGLVHKAQATPFGRAHDFSRIRTPADFRRLVPLRPATTPSALPWESHRRALLTALALATHGRADEGSRHGKVCVRMRDADWAAHLSWRLPLLLRPFVEFTAEADSVTRRHIPQNGIVVLDALWRAEGPIALADRRHGNLRLLTDHGVFFEFVPVEEVNQPRPTRHALSEVEQEVAYAIAVTAGGDVWASLTDVAVRFERRQPALVCRVFAKRPPQRPRHVVIPPPRHRQSAGTPATPPETTVHSSWLVRADRG
jgi:hypothetical protein